ncbi:MAG: PaaI family thioesterase [Flavobacteriales bacterium]
MKWNLFLLGKLKIPMLAYTGVRLVELNDTNVKVVIKLKRRTKNHLNSMYFGALAVGADVAGGIHAFYYAEKLNKKISFAFKGMNAHFIKRATTDCIFISKDGKKVEDAVLLSIKTQERVNETTKVYAYDTANELVAEFDMVVSVKCLK